MSFSCVLEDQVLSRGLPPLQCDIQRPGAYIDSDQRWGCPARC
jgi:hypothetical protein